MIHDIALMMDRERAGGEASPTAGVADSQSVKAQAAKERGCDGGYDGTKLMDKAAYLDFIVEIVRRINADPGFKVLPRRWVVERTFGWMTRWRRLVRDYERRIDVSGGMMLIAISSLLLRRVRH